MATSTRIRRRNPRPGERDAVWTDPSAEWRRLLAEALGTASLLAAIVGSGIVAQQDGPASVQLFQHAIVVGLALTALILTFGPISGAHFNPAVTVADAWFGGLPWRRAAGYVAAQLLGGVAGVAFTSATFGGTALELATGDRSGWGLVAAEVAATAGLIVVIFGVVRSGGGRVVAAAVGAYIAAAIYFTASASFANPAVTVARMLSDTYTGIAPGSVPGFLLGQAVGTAVGIGLVRVLFAPAPAEAREVIVPHDASTHRIPAGGELPHRGGQPMSAPQLSLAQCHSLHEAVTRLRREFDGIFAVETIQRFLDDSLAKLSGAADLDYVSLLAERFARERLRAITKMEGHLVSEAPTVLFLCVHNAGRSQMAAGWLRHLAGDRVTVLSGGSEPAHMVNPSAVEAMAEKGIDITDQFPKPWTDETVGVADVIVTMGCGDACPVLPGKRYLDWELDDPAGKDVKSVRPIRDDIERRVRALMADLHVAPITEPRDHPA